MKVMANNGRLFTKAFKKHLQEVSGYSCQYCGEHLETLTDMDVDHIVARSAGGSNDISNLRAACHPCNSMKRGWDIEHFRWLMTFRRSKYYGTITASQAKKLMSMGVELDMPKPFEFFFEVNV